jgi:hypothetical protein
MLSEAKHLMSLDYDPKTPEILRYAQDDKVGGISNPLN